MGCFTFFDVIETEFYLFAAGLVCDAVSSSDERVFVGNIKHDELAGFVV